MTVTESPRAAHSRASASWPRQEELAETGDLEIAGVVRPSPGHQTLMTQVGAKRSSVRFYR